MKKMMILIASAVALASGAQAQVSVTPEVGINFANMHGMDIYNTTNFDNNGGIKMGMKAGVNVNVPLSNHFVLQPGLFYSIQGYKDHNYATMGGLSFKNNYTLDYAQIPLNLQYMFNDVGDGRFFVGVGGYGAVALTGKDKYMHEVSGEQVEGTTQLHFGNDAPSNDLRRFDFGAQANAGYQFRCGMMVRAMYQAGISNMLPQGNRTTGDASLRNTNIGVSVGYTLGSMRKHKTVSDY